MFELVQVVHIQFVSCIIIETEYKYSFNFIYTSNISGPAYEQY